MGSDISNPADEESVTSTEDNHHRAGSVLSMDDPDVRIAAQALGDLRADFIHSPPNQSSPLPPPFSTLDPAMNGERRSSQQPEPLLSLLTTSHPLLSTAINGSLSAYSTSKSYSPRFKSGAEFVERHIGSPVATTVNTVGRRSGVEGGVRWWLGSRRGSAIQQGAGSRRGSAVQQSSEDEEGEGAHKRQKVNNVSRNGSIDLERNLYMGLQEYGQRRQSQLSFESLPAYDDYRSPSYDSQNALITTQKSEDGRDGNANSTWQSRLMLSTSGLGIAMSDESLRSLKYCLTWLRWANIHLGKVIIALKDVLEEWDQSQARVNSADPPSPASPKTVTNGHTSPGDTSTSGPVIPHPAVDEAAISQKIHELKRDVLKTLKKVVDVVSKYAGGALPENARLLVRRHLTSLPQRFHLAATSNPTMSDALQPTSETASSAHRVMVLAREGLDMMAQVSGVVDGTIVSAEEWCERLGRRKRGEPEEDPATEAPRDLKDTLLCSGSEGREVTNGEISGGDVKMGGDVIAERSEATMNGHKEKAVR
ncbi:MAG: hypothetical protein M1817_005155 [Caeruleum heppii]|nr:MAG: hypothetical protein M1817_005155 [Caeruleum heppii]